MGGIAGMVRMGGGDPLDPEILLRMRETLRHRGPDDAGIWFSRDGRVGLAHRRLSILDLSEAGKQPMDDGAGQTWVTYNGEIYNFIELRAELERRGLRFSSETDTEVLLAAYREWKESCLDRLNGMFAFALFDERSKQLFLARDRAGKKPFYYAFAGDRFIFASELNTLLRDPAVSREIDLRALNFFLAYGFVPGDLSIFRGIRKLPPAHAMTLELASGRLRRWRYWWLPVPRWERNDKEDLLAELESLLEDAVRIRLRSDVPLGVLLSGGLDSSLVVALTSRVSSRPVETFTIRFKETEQKEQDYANTVARRFGTSHHELVIQSDVLEILPELMKQFDEPLADPSLIPTYYVCRETRKSVTVALSGEGGKQLFGGYLRYGLTHRDARIIESFPAHLRRWAATASCFFPRGSRPREYILRLQHDTVTNFVARTLLFDHDARSNLLQRDVLNELGEDLLEPEMHLRSWFKISSQDFVNRMTATDFHVYLPDDILVKVDRASMFVSLEVRAPLLDYRVAEFSFSRVPGSLNVNREERFLLQRLGSRLLPPASSLSRKAGCGIPLRAWLGRNAGGLMEMIPTALPGLFNHRYMEKVVRSGGRGLSSRDCRIFALLVFEYWRQAH
ncbi:MAG: asparagine synthase (glutamine-hydrolyzing), partial [Dehalococcoidia bacterium]